MYAGRIVEEGAVEQIFDTPAHGYTHALLSSLAVSNRDALRLPEIPGNTPRIRGEEHGCSFAPRCAFAEAECGIAPPLDIDVGMGHRTRCRRHAEVSRAVGSHSDAVHGETVHG
jgi:oligopeptide/dipeptide ABC transporter ATP-binding protein